LLFQQIIDKRKKNKKLAWRRCSVAGGGRNSGGRQLGAEVTTGLGDRAWVQSVV